MIYENICRIAKEKGFSIAFLERQAKMSVGSICKWESNVSPTVKNLKKVADILGCTLDDLLKSNEVNEKSETEEKGE